MICKACDGNGVKGHDCGDDTCCCADPADNVICGVCGGWGVDDPDKMVTVCSACLQASCWQGQFYCDAHQTAGTVEKTVRELRDLNREHPSYWR